MIPLIIAGQAAAGILGVVSGSIAANKARIDKQRYEQELLDLENNRQEIINPYENITDLSSMLSNPLANLGVATQAAEMQIEQADISLANSLDIIRATGASAGGATALAQAALQSKKGVSASIEQQEAQNERLRAQGEQQLQTQKMAEAQRIQNARAAGDQFVFGAQEARDVAELDRTSDLLSQSEARQMQARADIYGAIGGTISGITGTVGSAAAAGYFDGNSGGDINPFLGDQTNYGADYSYRADGIPSGSTGSGVRINPGAGTRFNSNLNFTPTQGYNYQVTEGGNNWIDQYRPKNK
tara:strand:- start:1095 stop:1994 length:900 start_codon:yes stop_codon:yes gene_type:complete